MSYLEELRAKVRKDRDVFIAGNATVHGDITIGEGSSIWFGAVLRAEHAEIRIGRHTNIQDGSIIHVDPGFPVHIGDEVVIGHGSIIHGAHIGSNSLIGMRATVLNGARVGSWCIIGAHALITENMVIPDHSIVMGAPGKIVKTLSGDQKERIKRNAAVYVELARKYLS
ncbi:MAG: gamma carbonic anhydrase family protein [Bacteroidota bacterium]|nr:gamma carbonic anhydrase family protein [Bacteroidota bacterium]